MSELNERIQILLRYGRTIPRPMLPEEQSALGFVCEVASRSETRLAELETEVVDVALLSQNRVSQLETTQACVTELEAQREHDQVWKPLPKGSPEINGIRFLLGKPDRCGDRKGIMATGYWSEAHEFWAWPYSVKPTHYKEIPPIPEPVRSVEVKS